MSYQQLQQRNGIFKVAHLSDLHLTSLADVKIRDLPNKRVLGYLWWQVRRRCEHATDILAALCRDLRELAPDHIVITGDLTHVGLPGEFQQVRQWLETLGSPTNVTVVPGNHEAYVRTPWERTFALWAPYMASDPGLRAGEEHAPDRSFFPSVRVRGHTVLIGATTARPSAPFFATGSLGTAQMDRLGDVLDSTRRQGLFRILLIHHPPIAGMVGWRKRLTDEAALRTLLTRHGVEMILHGHAHRSSVAYLPNGPDTIPVIGAPSASARRTHPKWRAGYYLYEVRPSSHEWEVHTSVRGYSPEGHCFVAGDQQVIEVPRSVAGSLHTTVHSDSHLARYGQRV